VSGPGAGEAAGAGAAGRAPVPKQGYLAGTRTRRLTFEGANNFRDLGGYPALDGRRTRWGLVYRSGSLHGFTSRDLEAFNEMGVKAVFDLRGASERSLEADPVASVHLPVLDELSVTEGAGLLLARSAGEAEDAMFRIYWGMLDRRGRVFGQLLAYLSQAENLPAVVHCAGGKDRTGIAAALLLSALGVPRETVLDDYSLTGQVAVQQADSFRRALASAGFSAEAASAVLQAPPGPMARALEELDRRYGSTEAYLLGPAGVSRVVLDRLRELLTEPA
jgi:protein-tyrosine phosphatase